MFDINSLTITYAAPFRQCLMFARERLITMRDAEAVRPAGERSPKTVGRSFDALGCRLITWYVACDVIGKDYIRDVRRKELLFDDDHVVVLIAAYPYIIPELPGSAPPNVIVVSNYTDRRNLQPTDPRWYVETSVEAFDIIIAEVDEAIVLVDAVIVANGQTPDTVLSLRGRDVTVNPNPV